MKITRQHITGAATIALSIGLSLALVSIPTTTLMSLIGTENGYILMYAIAFLGSITTFASIPYPLLEINLVTGGFYPLMIGLMAAFGVMTADSMTFFAAKKGRALLSPKLVGAFTHLTDVVQQHPKWLTPGLILYGTLSPLSNDFAVISLSLMQYRYRQVILPLAIGNIIYNIGIAYLGIYAYDWITGIL